LSDPAHEQEEKEPEEKQVHCSRKGTWPGDAHDQETSTSGSRVSSRKHSKNPTKMVKRKQKKVAPRNSTKTSPNLHEKFPKIAQEKLDLLRIYPQEIIA